MKTFPFGIACAAMLAFLFTVTGCGESGGKAKPQTKAQTKSATDSRLDDVATPATNEAPARSEDDQSKDTEATTDRPPASEAVEIPLDRIWA